ncbi:MAG: hypothetical protein WC745_02970 [Patescibacteria group bacterium]|jgi:hypothetical protein
MKLIKEISNKNAKINYSLISLLFWVVVVILPYKYFYLLSDNGSLLIDYMIVIPPVMVFLAYALIKPKEKLNRNYFLIVGLIMPLIFHYAYLAFMIMEAIKGFRPSL